MPILDTRTIIVNLLKVDKETYLSLGRLQKLLFFIYDELIKNNEIDKYNICFNVNFDSIERTILFNNDIFKLDIDGEIIYLRKSVEELANKFKTDKNIENLIEKFIKSTLVLQGKSGICWDKD